MIPIEDIAGYLVKGLLIILSGFSGFLWWLVKADKKKLEDHDKDIAVLKSMAVSEDKVREIVTEAMDPFREDLKEIKDLVRENSITVKHLEISLAQQAAYQQAYKELKAKQDQ